MNDHTPKSGGFSLATQVAFVGTRPTEVKVKTERTCQGRRYRNEDQILPPEGGGFSDP